MSSCDRFQPLLSRVAEGEADPTEAISLARHLPDCTACRIVLARERRLAEMLENELKDTITVGKGFLRRLMQRLPQGPPPRSVRRGLKLAAGAALFALGWKLFDLIPALGAEGVSPALPNLELQGPESMLEALQAVAGLLVVVVKTLGTALAPGLPPIGGALGLAIAATLPLGTAATMLALFALAARQLHRITDRPHYGSARTQGAARRCR